MAGIISMQLKMEIKSNYEDFEKKIEYFHIAKNTQF